MGKLLETHGPPKPSHAERMSRPMAKTETESEASSKGKAQDHEDFAGEFYPASKELMPVPLRLGQKH